MVLYIALPKKEYKRFFMCKTYKDIWQSLLITHQGNIQVKYNKIDLLVQQYEQFTILEEESMDSGFARFNTVITSLKALDDGLSSKNYVSKFLRALHPKWRAKVMTIKESKDLSSLALDELIGNLKVHKVVMEKILKSIKAKERVRSIALKAKKEFSDDETLTSGSDDKELLWPDEKKGESYRKCFRCSDPNHLISDFPKPPCNKYQKAFIGGSWSDSEDDTEDKTNDETSLMAQSSNEKFGLEDSKPTKTSTSTEIKLTKDDEADFVDSSKYREAVKHIFKYVRGTTHLGLWYSKGIQVETIVYADFDHAGDYVDHKSTSGICTFMGCCLTSWFAKKQTALAISTIEAEYVSVRKACQQALWMKQALIDYDIRLDIVPIMIDYVEIPSGNSRQVARFAQNLYVDSEN
nr:retrovirus-related Pol polyprotein from transposon TNT 1-94 [Tanacetum cinerariifolium]